MMLKSLCDDTKGPTPYLRSDMILKSYVTAGNW